MPKQIDTRNRNADWITVSEGVRRAGIGRRAMENLIAAGLVSTRRMPGSQVRINAAEFQALMDKHTTPAKGSEQ